MIGKITGRLDFRATDHVLIDVQGVGYLVYCSDRTLAQMSSPGGVVALYTELLVREDNLQLFGFSTLAEKEWHKLLTSVQGVGAKAALAIAGTLGVDGVSRAIALGDIAAIKSAPGIGPKLAQRIVVELKDKAPKLMALGAQGAAPAKVDQTVVIDMPTPRESAGAHQPMVGQNAAAQADALSALLNLGYGHGEAAAAVAEASGNAPDASSSEMIKAALKLLAPKG